MADGGEEVNGKAWTYVVVALLAGIGGTAGYQQVVPPRPDPFTGSAAALLEQQILREIDLDLREHRVEVNEMILGILRPPQPARDRIRSMERILKLLAQEHELEWDPPTDQFSRD